MPRFSPHADGEIYHTRGARSRCPRSTRGRIDSQRPGRLEIRASPATTHRSPSCSGKPSPNPSLVPIRPTQRPLLFHLATRVLGGAAPPADLHRLCLPRDCDPDPASRTTGSVIETRHHLSRSSCPGSKPACSASTRNNCSPNPNSISSRPSPSPAPRHGSATDPGRPPRWQGRFSERPPYPPSLRNHRLGRELSPRAPAGGTRRLLIDVPSPAWRHLHRRRPRRGLPTCLAAESPSW